MSTLTEQETRSMMRQDTQFNKKQLILAIALIVALCSSITLVWSALDDTKYSSTIDDFVKRITNRKELSVEEAATKAVRELSKKPAMNTQSIDDFFTKYVAQHGFQAVSVITETSDDAIRKSMLCETLPKNGFSAGALEYEGKTLIILEYCIGSRYINKEYVYTHL